VLQLFDLDDAVGADNVEHLNAGPGLVDRSVPPSRRCLTAARLRVSGKHRNGRTAGAPDPGPLTVNDLDRFSAVRLFVDGAPKAVRLRRITTSLPTSRRLPTSDGLPLAIELAAPSVGTCPMPSSRTKLVRC
jgi:hypothetical protein